MAQMNIDLETIKTARDNIKIALQNYGATPSNDIRTYGSEIGNLPIAKLYSNIENMESDQNSLEGTYGLIYGEVENRITSDTEFQNVKFPQNVVLQEAFSDNVSGQFRAVGEGWADIYISIGRSEAIIEIMGENNLTVNYSSTDGITYTRETDVDTFDIGTVVKFSEYDVWDDLFGYFILTGIMAYNGIYQYNMYNDSNLIHLVPMSSITKEGTGTSAVFTWDGSFTNTVYDVSKMTDLGTRLCATEYPTLSTDYYSLLFALDENNNLIAFSIMKTAQKTNWNDGSIYLAYLTDTDKMGIYTGSSNKTDIPVIDIYDIDTSGSIYNYTYRETINSTIGYGTYGRYFDITLNSLMVSVPVSDVNYGHNYHVTNYINSIQPNGGMGQNSLDLDEYAGLNTEYLKWQICSNQFNLIDSDCLLTGNIALGANSTIEGTLGSTIANSFDDNIADLVVKAQNYYDTLTPVVLTDGETYGKSNARIIPTKSDGTPLLDISNMTNTSNLFKNYEKLVEICNLNTTNSTNGNNMFAYTYGLKFIRGSLDTSNMTSMRNMFASTTLQYINGSKNWVFNCSSATDIYYMFGYCKSVKNVTFTNTDNITDAGSLFFACDNLENVSGMDTNNLTNMQSMFTGCGKLTDDSLNNILNICIGSAMTANRTLKYIGLTNAQANKCKTLSNYSASHQYPVVQPADVKAL